MSDAPRRGATLRLPGAPRERAIVIAAGAGVVLWLVLVLLIGFVVAGGFTGALLVLLLVVPMAALGFGLVRLRADLHRAEATLAALAREAPDARADVTDAALQELEHRLDELARAWARPPSAHPPPSPRGERPSAASGAGTQPSLALGDGPGVPPQPPELEDLLIALNFPENAEDAEGFRALRRVMQDRTSALLIQASQDMLTLLSQDGIYMDDLRPDRPRPDEWRRFARGERGRPVAALGAIRDHAALARVSGRMRADTIFRDAAHHFLRRFDQMLTGFEKGASDGELAALAETRTARAFMLLGRAAGIFD